MAIAPSFPRRAPGRRHTGSTEAPIPTIRIRPRRIDGPPAADTEAGPASPSAPPANRPRKEPGDQGRSRAPHTKGELSKQRHEPATPTADARSSGPDKPGRPPAGRSSAAPRRVAEARPAAPALMLWTIRGSATALSAATPDQLWKSSGGGATGPSFRAAWGCPDRTQRGSRCFVQGGLIQSDFRKREEGKLAAVAF
jgi:hypothetical protein